MGNGYIDLPVDGGGGGGTVTSVTASSPLSSTGGTTPNIFISNQAANLVLAGPTTGAAAAPTFRSLVFADMNATPNATTSTVVARDTNGNSAFNGIALGTATSNSGSRIVLTVSDKRVQRRSGGSNGWQLPDAGTLPLGDFWVFINNSTSTQSVFDLGGTTLATLGVGTSLELFLATNGTSSGTWIMSTVMSITGSSNGVARNAAGQSNFNGILNSLNRVVLNLTHLGNALNDSSGNPVVDLENRLLLDGANLSYDIGARQIIASTGTNTVDGEAAVLNSSVSGITNLDWSQDNLCQITHIAGGLSSPSGIAAGTGAGTSPTVTLLSASSDVAGQVSVTTGTTPAGTNATIVTVTFGAAYSRAPIVVITPGNAAAAGLNATNQVFAGRATGNFTIVSGTVALTAATQYIWNYHIIGHAF